MPLIRLFVELFKIRFIAYVVLGCLTLQTAYSYPKLSPSVQAALGNGTRGTFTAEWRDPSRGDLHSWRGTFTTDRPPVTRPHVYLSGGDQDSIRKGDRVGAIDTGSDTDVYPTRGSNAWAFALGFVLLGAVAALLLLARVIIDIRILARSWRPERDSASR
ncbi:hypothetical protein ACQEU3_20780 [Spirillospora sp. CA-253888]